MNDDQLSSTDLVLEAVHAVLGSCDPRDREHLRDAINAKREAWPNAWATDRRKSSKFHNAILDCLMEEP